MSEKPPPATIANLSPVWWETPWWEEVDYQTECNLSLDQIRATIEALKRLFNEQWTAAALNAGPPNVILAMLYGGKGLWPFQDLMWLGRIAAATGPIPSVRLPLRDLSGPKTWSALLELEVASWFVEQRWQVEFLKPGKDCKTPDLAIQRDGLATAVECKRFGSEQWEEWSQDLTLALMRQGNRGVSAASPSVDVLFESRLSDLVWDDTRVRTAIREELTECISAAIRETLEAEPPRSVRIPGIADVKLRPDLKGGGLHGIGGIEVSPQAKLRRIVRNGVLVAARQLDTVGPGAVVIKTDFTPPKELVNVVLRGLNRADESLLRSVACVVIAESPGSPAVIWQNPLLVDQPVSAALVSTFTALLCKEAKPREL